MIHAIFSRQLVQTAGFRLCGGWCSLKDDAGTLGMTQKLACVYISEVVPRLPPLQEPASPWFWAALEPGDTSLRRQDPPESLSACSRAAPLALSEHPQLGRASPAPSPGRGGQWEMSPAPSRCHKEQTKAHHPWCSAPVLCTWPREKGPDGRRRVFGHPHGRQRHHRGHRASRAG